MSEPICNRYDFVFFYDVENGNPNGDPDAGNMPRIDPETGVGIVSDVCIKRKIRNYVEITRGGESKDGQGYRIYVQQGAILNEINREAYNRNSIASVSKNLPKSEDDQRKVTQFMCDNFYDIRTFGAVMTTDVNCGQVRGPVQLCFSQSVEPIVPAEMSITRMAVTNIKDADKGKTMGRKAYVPYGLYRLEGFISASLAEKSGFSQADLNLLFESLMGMFECDRSAARGLMTSRKLIIFKHDSKLGNVSARSLSDLVSCRKVASDVARKYSDYEIVIDESKIPNSVSMNIVEEMLPAE